MRRAALAFGLLAALAACDGEDPVDAALRDAAAARQAEALKVTGESEAPATTGLPAPTQSAEQHWIDDMINADGRDIIDAENMLEDTEDPAVRAALQDVITTRKRELVRLEALREPDTAAGQ